MQVVLEVDFDFQGVLVVDQREGVPVGGEEGADRDQERGVLDAEHAVVGLLLQFGVRRVDSGERNGQFIAFDVLNALAVEAHLDAVDEVRGIPRLDTVAVFVYFEANHRLRMNWSKDQGRPREKVALFGDRARVHVPFAFHDGPHRGVDGKVVVLVGGLLQDGPAPVFDGHCVNANTSGLEVRDGPSVTFSTQVERHDCGGSAFFLHTGKDFFSRRLRVITKNTFTHSQ